MFKRLDNSLRVTLASFRRGACGVPALLRPTRRTRIDTDFGARLDVLDRRPGHQVTIFIHGCGTTEAEVDSIERKVADAEIAGTSYLLSWDGPDVTEEALREAGLAVRRCLDLVMAAPSPLGLAVATGVAATTGTQRLFAGGHAAYETGLAESNRIADRFGDVLDRIPELGEGVRLNLVGHSMGAAMIARALEKPEIASRVRDAILLGSITTDTPTARRRTINVYSRADEALARLGPTLGNGGMQRAGLTMVEVDCAHAAYWRFLGGIIPKSWRIPKQIRDAIETSSKRPCVAGAIGHRPFEVRLYALEQK